MFKFGNPFDLAVRTSNPFNILERNPFNILERLSLGNDPFAAQIDFPVDVKNTDTAYMLSADLPGVKLEDIELTYDDQASTLNIQVNRNETREENTENYRMRERYTGSMARSIRLPDGDSRKIEARLTHGVLSVTIPKNADNRSRKVRIALQ